MADEFRSLADDPDREQYLDHVLFWAYLANKPYLDWLFGGEAESKEVLTHWLKSDVSENSLRNVWLYFRDGMPYGGIICLNGEDLVRARKADAISLINTCLAMAVDWRRRRPRLGAGMGGLSGPAIKPIALRAVYQVARAVDVPLVGIGGIASIDDCMEFLVAGATAIQIGTANFYRPTVSIEILDALPGALAELQATCVADVVGTLKLQDPPQRCRAEIEPTMP